MRVKRRYKKIKIVSNRDILVDGCPNLYCNRLRGQIINDPRFVSEGNPHFHAIFICPICDNRVKIARRDFNYADRIRR